MGQVEGENSMDGDWGGRASVVTNGELRVVGSDGVADGQV